MKQLLHYTLTTKLELLQIRVQNNMTVHKRLQQLQHLLAGSGIDVLVQGQGSRRRLLERFRQGGGVGRPCVLLASGAFWEGVDVPGDALQMLVIDKLPFPVPDDPLVQARSQALRQQGLSPFEA